MTILNVTVTAELVALSSDTAIADPVASPLEGAASADLAELMMDFADPAQPVFPGPIRQYRRKIAVLAEQRRIVAASGAALLTVVSAGILALWGGGSLEDELGELAAGLSKVRELVPPGAATGMVLLGAYDDELGAAAFMLGSGDGWTPRRMEQGTATMPMPSPHVDGYGALYALYVAGSAAEVEALHSALAHNQVEAARRGLYRAGPAMGGDLWLATVDRNGAHQRLIGNLC